MMLLVLALSLAAQADREAAAPDFVALRVCSTADLDPTLVHSSAEGAPGAAFWLRPAELGDELTGNLSLVDGNGQRTPTSVVARLPHVVAVRVPADAVVGAVLSLESGGTVVATALRVVAADGSAPTLTLTSITGGEPVAATCNESTCSQDGSAPRTLTFDLVYTGGPAVLDVFILDPSFGMVENDLDVRTVEARLLPAATDGALHVEAGPAVLSSGAIDVRFRARALDGTTILADELVALPSVPQAIGGEALPPCNVNPPCVDQGCGRTTCFALTFFAFGMRGLRRRRPIAA